MVKVHIVAPNNVYQVWGDVESYLNASINTNTGSCSIDQLKLLLVQGAQTLLVGTNENNKIVGAMTVEFVNEPNDRIMLITNLGGHQVVNKETFDQVETWARSNGATKARAVCQEAQARLYKLKSDFNAVRMIVEKDL